MKKTTLPTNPRQLRVLKALAKEATSRRDLDAIAGALNSPELVSQLRKRGLDIKCNKTPMLDRDGRTVYAGIYYFEEESRQAVKLALSQQGVGIFVDGLKSDCIAGTKSAGGRL